MWRENQAGDFYWPLHPTDQTTHLRVWRGGPVQIAVTIPRGSEEEPGWLGALVIDGEYLDQTRVGPFPTAAIAQRAVHDRAHEFIEILYDRIHFS